MVICGIAVLLRGLSLTAGFGFLWLGFVVCCLFVDCCVCIVCCLLVLTVLYGW